MQLEWISAFLAVVDRGGFAAASVHLYRSQGRISSHVASLERELGVQLFDRHQRPAKLTAAGHAFLDHARSMVEDLEAGRIAIAAVENLVRGDVALATYPSAGAAYVPYVLSRFARDCPGIRAELVEHAVHGIDLALAERSALVAIRPVLPPPPSTLSLGSEALWREPMCLVVPDQHRLADRPVVRLTDLREEDLVVSGQNLHDDTEAFRLLAAEGVRPRAAFVSDQPQTLVGLVLSRMAIGFTNRLALETVRTEGIAVIDIHPPLHREVAVFWTPALHASKAATALLEAIRATPAPATTVDLRSCP